MLPASPDTVTETITSISSGLVVLSLAVTKGTESLNLGVRDGRRSLDQPDVVDLVGAMFSKWLGRSHNRRSIA